METISSRTLDKMERLEIIITLLNPVIRIIITVILTHHTTILSASAQSCHPSVKRFHAMRFMTGEALTPLQSEIFGPKVEAYIEVFTLNVSFRFLFFLFFSLAFINSVPFKNMIASKQKNI